MLNSTGIDLVEDIFSTHSSTPNIEWTLSSCIHLSDEQIEQIRNKFWNKQKNEVAGDNMKYIVTLFMDTLRRDAFKAE